MGSDLREQERGTSGVNLGIREQFMLLQVPFLPRLHKVHLRTIQ